MSEITQIILRKYDKHSLIRFYATYHSDEEIFINKMVELGWKVEKSQLDVPTYDGCEQKLANFLEGIAHEFYELGGKDGITNV